MHSEKIIIEGWRFSQIMEEAHFWIELAEDNAIDEYGHKIAITKDALKEQMHLLLDEALEELVRSAKKEAFQ